MELYSLTTGLIGQSGRRGALMLTIDVKHPDIEHFLKVKKVPNWVTNQIVDQCNWSGRFDNQELETIKKQVMENTQVRFANISVKASDEFMQAVDEQREYHQGEFLIYKKKKNNILKNAPQGVDDVHYSINIPSKNISNYELMDELGWEIWDQEQELSKWLDTNCDERLKERGHKIKGFTMQQLQTFAMDIKGGGENITTQTFSNLRIKWVKDAKSELYQHFPKEEVDSLIQLSQSIN